MLRYVIFVSIVLALDFNISLSRTGLSTTSDGGWSLGGIKAKYCGKDAEEWFTEYLGIRMTKRFEKKKVKPRFRLVRSAGQGRQCSNYAGPLQLPYSSDVSDQRSGKASPFNMTKVPVLANDRVHFADSFPFLLTSIDSLNALRAAMDVQNYPMTAFRPNIVIGVMLQLQIWWPKRIFCRGRQGACMRDINLHICLLYFHQHQPNYCSILCLLLPFEFHKTG